MNSDCSEWRKSCIQKVKLEMVHESTDSEKVEVSSPEDVWRLDLLQSELANSDREKFLCLHLDQKHAVVSYEVVSVGSLNSSVVHPREVFKAAILANSSSIVLCHNHPSGDPRPSADDICLTQRLVEAGELLGISVVDHVVFGRDDFSSLRAEGYL